MDDRNKRYFTFSILYLPNKKIEFDLNKFYNGDNYRYQLTIWLVRKLVDIEGYKNEYESNWWKHFVLWRGSEK